MKLFKSTVASIAVLAAAGAVSADEKDIAEQMRDVAEFTEVSLQGSMDVEVRVGGEQSVKVIADADVIEYLETRVRGGELRIDLDCDGARACRRIKKLEVLITVPKLEAAEVHGSGDLYVENVKTDHFELEVHGSGDAVVNDAELTRLDIDLQGSGDIKIDGSCNEVRMDLQGSGDIEAGDMTCKDAEVSLHGSGDIEVHASASADVSVRGSGDIVVRGKPDKISSSVRGSGDIHVRS